MPFSVADRLRTLPARLLCGAVLVGTAATAQAQTASFRVTGSELVPGGKEVKVQVMWTYQSTGSYYSGKGVKFYLHARKPGAPDAMPGYGNAQKGTPIAQTVDMKNGSGKVTLTAKLPKNAKPGQELCLTGVWPSSNHQWGTDAARLGGLFKLPTGAVSGFEVSVNSATPDELASVPGIGKAVAQRIVTLRDQQKGKKFTSLDQLTGVQGISKKSLDKVRTYLTTKVRKLPKQPPKMSINVNSASAATLALVPGIGTKMAQAIVDYRQKLKKNKNAYSRKISWVGQLSSVPGISYAKANLLSAYLKTNGRSELPKGSKNSRMRSLRGVWGPAFRQGRQRSWLRTPRAQRRWARRPLLRR